MQKYGKIRLLFVSEDSNTFDSMNLTDRFKEFAHANHLLADERPTLLAISGGVDSVVMAQLFREAGYAFGIAHCNFQLRGLESDADEHLARQLADSWKTPFFSKRFETAEYAEKNGLSIQMAARELRYAWFGAIAADNGYARIATAHNLNDAVETALFNFTRGTGLSGMKGIAVSARFDAGYFSVAGEHADNAISTQTDEQLRLIRPLLFATRASIEEYARQMNLVWREDSSNKGVDYARNFIRHRVVPLLESLNPNFLHTAGRNLERLCETHENLHFLLREYFEETAGNKGDFCIVKQKLARLPAPRRALRELIGNLGFTEEQSRQVAANPNHIGLEIYSNSGWRLLNDRDYILIVPSGAAASSPSFVIASILPDDLIVALPDGARLVLMHSDVVSAFPDGRESVLIDSEKLRFPLTLRPWQHRDYFQPIGMNGHSQKLQDFFTNLKLSRLEKEKALVLADADGAIVWVVGHRLDERFKVTSGTKKFLKISYLQRLPESSV